MAEPLFYVKDQTIFKRPIEKPNPDGTRNVTLGFPVCEASEYVDANDIAAIFNENEPPPEAAVAKPESEMPAHGKSRSHGVVNHD